MLSSTNVNSWSPCTADLLRCWIIFPPLVFDTRNQTVPFTCWLLALTRHLLALGLDPSPGLTRSLQGSEVRRRNGSTQRQEDDRLTERRLSNSSYAVSPEAVQAGAHHIHQQPSCRKPSMLRLSFDRPVLLPSQEFSITTEHH
ncbi:unnamed protein product [Pleuronectes platessa]|uniref:Uncharacterized protein n=1 Tax=Pleuronectes platessa TaxID=8262 RepID=A0A9N7UFD2_PLEPL|nr:unnamed protein product [Pleuronectes platessa]